MAEFEIGVDIGGTFTDLVLVEAGVRVVASHKLLTTPDDPSRAVLAGIGDLVARTGVTCNRVGRVIHATTLITNATIERSGAPTGMLVTAGFRDILDIGREFRYDLSNLKIDFPEPLVPRAMRREVSERILATGAVELPLDEAAVIAAVTQLHNDHGIASLAICFLHSYQYPAHELLAGRLVAQAFPDLHVTLSHEVSPFSREYERWTTATINAYTRPLIDTYLDRLQEALRTLGFAGGFGVMTSSGGIATVEVARRFPVRLIESGPAAGVLAAAYLGQDLADNTDVLAFDMGGTTAKGAFVVSGDSVKHSEIEVARVNAFQKGSGLTARVPAIDLIEIGAGGGTIAELDQRGLIRVGPRSAGADPGPACYGRGGTRATLTDANLLLGYLGADSFLGGTMSLDTGAAERVVQHAVAQPLDIPLERAALGIHDTVNEDVVRALRVHAAELGLDYRRFPIVCTGGSAPIHAVGVARKLRAPRVVFPLGAGVMSAFGLLVSPPSHEIMRSDLQRLDDLDTEAVRARFAPLAEEARGYLGGAKLVAAALEARYFIAMRYVGQGHEITVEISDPFRSDGVIDGIREAYEGRYRDIFGISFLDQSLECVEWKVEVFVKSGMGKRLHFDPLAGEERSPKHPSSPTRTRPAYFAPGGWIENCPVYDRYGLRPGSSVAGPALIEERESTAVLGPGDSAVVDRSGNLLVNIHFA